MIKCWFFLFFFSIILWQIGLQSNTVIGKWSFQRKSHLTIYYIHPTKKAALLLTLLTLIFSAYPRIFISDFTTFPVHELCPLNFQKRNILVSVQYLMFLFSKALEIYIQGLEPRKAHQVLFQVLPLFFALELWSLIYDLPNKI